MDDLISRQAAIDICCSNCLMECRLDVETKAQYCKSVKQLMGLPSAERNGRWVLRRIHDCHKCGARMEDEEEE